MKRAALLVTLLLAIVSVGSVVQAQEEGTSLELTLTVTVDDGDATDPGDDQSAVPSAPGGDSATSKASDVTRLPTAGGTPTTKSSPSHTTATEMIALSVAAVVSSMMMRSLPTRALSAVSGAEYCRGSGV